MHMNNAHNQIDDVHFFYKKTPFSQKNGVQEKRGISFSSD